MSRGEGEKKGPGLSGVDARLIACRLDPPGAVGRLAAADLRINSEIHEHFVGRDHCVKDLVGRV